MAAAPVDHLVALPDNMDFTSAAALLVNHHTTHFALAQRGRLQPGETLLVLGAAGGIGSAAVQVGKGLGARVIAGVASRSQFPVAEAAGADSVVVLGEGFSVPVRELTAQRGVDAVLDPLGDWLLQESMRCLAPEGRALIVGFAAGGIPTIKVNRPLLNNIAAVGVAWGARLAQDPDLLRNGAAALHEMFARGVVHPQISARYDFADLPHALTELQHGNISGKAVVDLRR